MFKINANYQHSQKDGRNATSDETFPRFLRAELYERSFSKKETKHVGHDVINDNHWDRNNKPNQALKDIDDNQVTLSDDNQQGDVGPSE